jgi:hypothetical protein
VIVLVLPGLRVAQVTVICALAPCAKVSGFWEMDVQLTEPVALQLRV